MRRSVGELRAEILKAGRGAGLPLGTAEDFAMAAPWIGPDALSELVALLARSDGAAVLTGMSLDLDIRAMGEVGQGTDGTALWTALCASRDGTEVPEPCDVDADVWSRLSRVAARTYVPETELSRARGAGAGNIDND
ncbi:MAG: DUF3726 domain-containing protein [Paracoccaceae bacterium]